MEARPVDPAEAHEAYIMLRAPRPAAAWTRRCGRNSPPTATLFAWAQRLLRLARAPYDEPSRMAELGQHPPPHAARLGKILHALRSAALPDRRVDGLPHMQTGERWERMISVDGKPQPSTTQMFWAGYSGMVFCPRPSRPSASLRTDCPWACRSWRRNISIIGPSASRNCSSANIAASHAAAGLAFGIGGAMKFGIFDQHDDSRQAAAGPLCAAAGACRAL